MKRAPRLTKRERKALSPSAATPHQHQHIHCVACGVHLDAAQFDASPATAQWIRCEHGSRFPSCTGCLSRSQQLVAEHDRTGQAIKSANAWH